MGQGLGCFLVALLCLVGLFSQGVRGDVYLHSVRGSNNRLDEANRDRANGNRLFDSQNNNRGGYNVGSEFYFVGEEKWLEWTNQHACNNPNMNCEIVIQMMCDPLLRDGTSTNRIPNTPEADTDYEYGRHESYEWYKACSTRQRNMGLFTASQNLQGDTAIYTRQNPNGQRRGLECPEERDYYPYWHPTPWRDIAVLTDNLDRCGYYQRESQNVRNKGYCHDNVTLLPVHPPNNPFDCETIDLGPNRSGVWLESGAFGIDPPICEKTPFNRDNHLGNGLGGQPNSFKWIVPNLIDESCALRLRYNISTKDYDGWDSRVNASLNDREGEALMQFIDTLEMFGTNSPITDGYKFENNPDVDIGFDGDLVFQLAINTAQLGRTFQDRSHRFAIRPKPDINERIVSLAVRGKRGNIVQVFPGVEYDFYPNRLEVSTDDYIHLQWTGSNTNPANNDGQGRQQSDRQNFVELSENDLGRSYPEHLSNSRLANATEFLPYFAKFLWSRDFTTTTGGELSELDDSGPYGRLGVFKITKSGEYNYMCTRNNNFSNRGQKATLVVSDGDDDDDMSTAMLVGIVVASVGFVIILTAIGIATAVYFNKQAKIAKREKLIAQQDDSVNPFSPMAEDSL